MDRARLPKHVRLLLDVLGDSSRIGGLDANDWDVLIRAARVARLLGVLAVRVRSRFAHDDLPEPVQRHLKAALNEARFRSSRAEYMMDAVARLLSDLGAPLVVLKGGAYIAQRLPMAEGRLLADVDLMIPRATLGVAERLLLDTGWAFQKTDPYDQHYYRAWSHELPPMRRAGQALELDLHHAILPPIGRLRPDTDALFEFAVPITGTRFRVLSPADQVLHAVAHLFQDSDCVGRLRDLVDTDALIRTFSSREPDFHAKLLDRAVKHNLGRPLWYAMELSRRWADTPFPSGFVLELSRSFRPNGLASTVVLGSASLTLPPADPDREPTPAARFAGTFMGFRALWLRMPPWLLVYHAIRKGMRNVAAWRPNQNGGTANA